MPDTPPDGRDPSSASQAPDGPYRDVREVLLAKRRRLRQELDDVARASERVEDLRTDLSIVEDALRKDSASLLDTVRLTTPCRERWEDMTGDDVVRRCLRCHRDVHDLSAMTASEAEAFLTQRRDASPRLRRRHDGRVVSAKCPRSSTRARKYVVLAVAVALSGATYVGTRPRVDATPPTQPEVDDLPRTSPRHTKVSLEDLPHLERGLVPAEHAIPPWPTTPGYEAHRVGRRSLTMPRRPRLAPVARGVLVRRPERTPWAEMGVRHGDTLLRTDHGPIGHRDDVEATLATFASERQLRLWVLREGRELLLLVSLDP